MENAPTRLIYGEVCGTFFPIDGFRESAQLIVYGNTTWVMALDTVRKQAEDIMKSIPVRIVLPPSLLQFLLLVPSVFELLH